MEQILKESCYSESYSCCFTVAKHKRVCIKITWGSIKEPKLMRCTVEAIPLFCFVFKKSKREKLRIAHYLTGFHTSVESWTFLTSFCDWIQPLGDTALEAVAETGSAALALPALLHRAPWLNSARNPTEKFPITGKFSQCCPIWPNGDKEQKQSIVPKLMHHRYLKSNMVFLNLGLAYSVLSPYRTSFPQMKAFSMLPRFSTSPSIGLGYSLEMMNNRARSGKISPALVLAVLSASSLRSNNYPSSPCSSSHSRGTNASLSSLQTLILTKLVETQHLWDLSPSIKFG